MTADAKHSFKKLRGGWRLLERESFLTKHGTKKKLHNSELVTQAKILACLCQLTMKAKRKKLITYNDGRTDMSLKTSNPLVILMKGFLVNFNAAQSIGYLVSYWWYLRLPLTSNCLARQRLARARTRQRAS
jgi:hypothetical protein